jgi:hypothetical protein
MGPMGSTETSINNYQHTLRNILEERRPQLHPGRRPENLRKARECLLNGYAQVTSEAIGLMQEKSHTDSNRMWCRWLKQVAEEDVSSCRRRFVTVGWRTLRVVGNLHRKSAERLEWGTRLRTTGRVLGDYFKEGG